MKIEPMPEGTGALIARMAADDRKAASELATPETAGPVPVVAAVANCSGSAQKRRWREYPAVQFSEADLPVWGYYPEGVYKVRLIDFMGNQMSHWMPAHIDIPDAPSVRQPTTNIRHEPDGGKAAPKAL